jgi:DNA-binding transcriptional regulator YiaG
MNEIPELTAEDFESAISGNRRRRLMKGDFRTGEDISALRAFLRLSQTNFAKALGISVHTLRNWEQGRRRPEGPALALLRIAARHPRIIHESLWEAA